MLSRQHHIAIIVSDYEKAKEFYMDKLGFQLVSEVYRPEFKDYLRMLRYGDTTIELFVKPDYPERVTNPEAKGLRHLAFRVDSAEEAAAWLRSRGIPHEPVREDKANGGHYVFFKDPDGLPLEFHD